MARASSSTCDSTCHCSGETSQPPSVLPCAEVSTPPVTQHATVQVYSLYHPAFFPLLKSVTHLWLNIPLFRCIASTTQRSSLYWSQSPTCDSTYHSSGVPSIPPSLLPCAEVSTPTCDSTCHSSVCDWMRYTVWSATSISVWQHVNLHEQTHPWETQACCWNVKQASHKRFCTSRLQTPPVVHCHTWSWAAAAPAPSAPSPAPACPLCPGRQWSASPAPPCSPLSSAASCGSARPLCEGLCPAVTARTHTHSLVTGWGTVSDWLHTHKQFSHWVRNCLWLWLHTHTHSLVTGWGTVSDWLHTHKQFSHWVRNCLWLWLHTHTHTQFSHWVRNCLWLVTHTHTV